MSCGSLRSVTFQTVVELLVDASADTPRPVMFNTLLALASELPSAVKSIFIDLIVVDMEERLMDLAYHAFDWEGFETLLEGYLTGTDLWITMRGTWDLPRRFDFTAFFAQRMPRLKEQGRLTVVTGG